jgi:hypothetical protein
MIRAHRALPCLAYRRFGQVWLVTGVQVMTPRGNHVAGDCRHATSIALRRGRSWLWAAVLRDRARHVHTFAYVPSERLPIFTNRCSLYREPRPSRSARSVRSVSPARSSCSRTTMTSTGRSTGTSHLVRWRIRIEHRCAGDLLAGGRGSRLRHHSPASPPSPHLPG